MIFQKANRGDIERGITIEKSLRDLQETPPPPATYTNTYVFTYYTLAYILSRGKESVLRKGPRLTGVALKR